MKARTSVDPDVVSTSVPVGCVNGRNIIRAALEEIMSLPLGSMIHLRPVISGERAAKLTVGVVCGQKCLTIELE